MRINEFEFDALDTIDTFNKYCKKFVYHLYFIIHSFRTIYLLPQMLTVGPNGRDWLGFFFKNPISDIRLSQITQSHTLS